MFCFCGRCCGWNLVAVVAAVERHSVVHFDAVEADGIDACSVVCQAAWFQMLA